MLVSHKNNYDCRRPVKGSCRKEFAEKLVGTSSDTVYYENWAKLSEEESLPQI